VGKAKARAAIFAAAATYSSSGARAKARWPGKRVGKVEARAPSLLLLLVVRASGGEVVGAEGRKGGGEDDHLCCYCCFF
jgi:hypothetical protein